MNGISENGPVPKFPNITVSEVKRVVRAWSERIRQYRTGDASLDDVKQAEDELMEIAAALLPSKVSPHQAFYELQLLEFYFNDEV